MTAAQGPGPIHDRAFVFSVTRRQSRLLDYAQRIRAFRWDREANHAAVNHNNGGPART